MSSQGTRALAETPRPAAGSPWASAGRRRLRWSGTSEPPQGPGEEQQHDDHGRSPVPEAPIPGATSLSLGVIAVPPGLTGCAAAMGAAPTRKDRRRVLRRSESYGNKIPNTAPAAGSSAERGVRPPDSLPGDGLYSAPFGEV